MDFVFDDFPRVLHQVSDFDILPENAIPFAHQYKQMYPCPACHMFLPYEGCDHGCTAVWDDEEDEGFHEHNDYLDGFHTFCADSARYRNVDLLYRCSEGEIHIIAPPIGTSMMMTTSPTFPIRSRRRTNQTSRLLAKRLKSS